MEIEITSGTEELLGELARLVAVANRRQRRRYIYKLRYDNAAWVHIARREYAFRDWTDIVPRDTPATEENLRAALEAMRDEIKKTKETVT